MIFPNNKKKKNFNVGRDSQMDWMPWEMMRYWSISSPVLQISCANSSLKLVMHHSTPAVVYVINRTRSRPVIEWKGEDAINKVRFLFVIQNSSLFCFTYDKSRMSWLPLSHMGSDDRIYRATVRKRAKFNLIRMNGWLCWFFGCASSSTK